MHPVHKIKRQPKAVFISKEHKQVLTNEHMSALLSNQYMELIILPTEQCNFRCTYCYEDFSIGRMQQATITAIKKLLKERASELRKLKLSWFGGEPLSARSIVFDISAFAKQLALEHGLEYMSGMTTNGFALTPVLMQKLNHVGVREFQISLDGNQEWHDKTRLRINQKGSFSQIWQNLLALKQTKLDFKITLRIHATQSNYESLFELLDMLKQNFSSDPRFLVYFKAIENLGGSGVQSLNLVDHNKQQDLIMALKMAVGEHLEICDLSDANRPYVCYASRPNSLVIRADGRIAKCTVALQSAANSIGYINAEGQLMIEQDKLQPWLQGLQNQDAKTLACPYQAIR